MSSEEDKLCDAPDLSVYYATEDDLKNPKSEAPSALLQTVLNEVKVEDNTTPGGGYENYNDWDDNGYGDQVDNNYDPTVPEVQEEQEEEYESDDEWKPLAKKMRKGVTSNYFLPKPHLQATWIPKLTSFSSFPSLREQKYQCNFWDF